MCDFEKIKGRWKSPAPWGSDDYLVLYVISGNELKPTVKAVDLNDGEEFDISEILWFDGFLSFVSYMPSTQRKGLNKFKLNSSGCITAEFTFTVSEELEREVI